MYNHVCVMGSKSGGGSSSGKSTYSNEKGEQCEVRRLERWDENSSCGSESDGVMMK